MGEPTASFEDVVRAARMAGADEFIQQLPKRYDTELEEGAVNLSGGQKQRISIARALLRQPRIIIFDEATSALDPESEAVVVKNLKEIAKGRTAIVICHRLATIRDADAIIVLDNGALNDVGSHAQLLQRNFVYNQLWNQQHAGAAGARIPQRRGQDNFRTTALDRTNDFQSDAAAIEEAPVPISAHAAL